MNCYSCRCLKKISWTSYRYLLLLFFCRFACCFSFLFYALFFLSFLIQLFLLHHLMILAQFTPMWWNINSLNINSKHLSMRSQKLYTQQILFHFFIITMCKKSSKKQSQWLRRINIIQKMCWIRAKGASSLSRLKWWPR